jgi:hypothetical protein
MIHAVLSLLVLAAAASGDAASGVVATTVKGDPGLQSIEVLGFAPDGVLLIGDGRGSQVVAVVTGDTKAAKPLESKIAGIDAKLAGRLGVAAKEIEILDVAVNPASGRIYLAVRRQTDKTYVVLTLDGSGEVAEFRLKDVEHARIPLPKGEQAPISKVTDVAWAGGRVLAAGRAAEEFASKIFVCRGPIKHEAKGEIYSAETYHVQHGKWETKAPMSVLMPYEEGGKLYVVGAYSCTPVVKYPIEALQPGARVKGISMVELGSGNQPLDMLSYRKDGKSYVLMNTFRFHHERRPFGPSPYWSARFEQELLAGEEKSNEKAVRRLGGDGKPATDRIQLVESLHGVAHLDRLDEKTALALRKTADGFDLEPIALP